ncbi:VapC toxin family PIN domain ribonuclease [Nonlabens spongiae]|uniref:VapC toxin family PIN domain ribonuclease n=1 Tax=Nonlabens spongiae TaxID=331648 RepID=A0A1W6MI27_9FLAO|nr:type II toxin-antitoxin system VapC family toxin [Nonlabens spongiae]ARN77227.1 VapC toxin family PIN domain ribonuclease [Nonlabens spongiae]
MDYLLDTNICIHLFRGEYDLDQKFLEIGLLNCAISEITLAELMFGAENSKNPSKNKNIIQEFTDEVKIIPIYNAIPIYASEKVRLRSIGKMISDFDLLIGATAVVYDFIMVTENLKEFNRIKGITLENWVNRN